VLTVPRPIVHDADPASGGDAMPFDEVLQLARTAAVAEFAEVAKVSDAVGEREVTQHGIAQCGGEEHRDAVR
jgi:hypothetical protein